MAQGAGMKLTSIQLGMIAGVMVMFGYVLVAWLVW